MANREDGTPSLGPHVALAQDMKDTASTNSAKTKIKVTQQSSSWRQVVDSHSRCGKCLNVDFVHAHLDTLRTQCLGGLCAQTRRFRDDLLSYASHPKIVCLFASHDSVVSFTSPSFPSSTQRITIKASVASFANNCVFCFHALSCSLDEAHQSHCPAITVPSMIWQEVHVSSSPWNYTIEKHPAAGSCTHHGRFTRLCCATEFRTAHVTLRHQAIDVG